MIRIVRNPRDAATSELIAEGKARVELAALPNGPLYLCLATEGDAVTVTIRGEELIELLRQAERYVKRPAPGAGQRTTLVV